MNGLCINDTLFVIIDIQEKLVNAIFNKNSCIHNITILAKSANILDIPVIITEQYPKGLGKTITDIQNNLQNTNIKYIEKTTFSAVNTEEFTQILEHYPQKQILLFGIETHICVNQTAEDLIRMGREVHIVKDACSSRSENEHVAGLERMKNKGAHILTTEIALFELIKTATHPKFKEIQTLIK